MLPLQNFGYHKIILLGQQNIVLLRKNYFVVYYFVGLNKVLLNQQNCLVRVIRYATRMRVHLLLAEGASTFMSNMTDAAVVLYARLKYIFVSRLYVMCLVQII